MTLIKSISGIRGTIGGIPEDNLTPLDTVRFTAAYGMYVKQSIGTNLPRIVVGRDARISGEMLQSLVVQTLVGMGFEVIDLGLSTTPTVAMHVMHENADGGIILTASHNPKEWNALKLLNPQGEFLDATAGEEILSIAAANQFDFAGVDQLGSVTCITDAIQSHIDAVLAHPFVDVVGIRSGSFTVVVDGVNSVGGIAIPALLHALGVKAIPIHCEPNGNFPHNPEPLKEHLTDLSAKVQNSKADFGIAVDPDVDRLAFVDEQGEMFGEEYTLVACADYVLSREHGNTVSNLSSTRALRDITEAAGGTYYASAVGEVNVVEQMKATNAVIGGEGNGGVIDPKLHYGRDAFIGVALFLSLLVEKKCTVSQLKAGYPQYFMAKGKIELQPAMDVTLLLSAIEKRYAKDNPLTIDGVKIDFLTGWVHLRKSNTEPIIRVYAEAKSQDEADQLTAQFIKELMDLAAKL